MREITPEQTLEGEKGLAFDNVWVALKVNRKRLEEIGQKRKGTAEKQERNAQRWGKDSGSGARYYRRAKPFSEMKRLWARVTETPKAHRA
jgi:hypothetical protein